jgi:DNA-binding transcriptional LysR family regulator
MEHGVGQTYGEGHSAYAGGPGRCGTVDVFLCPNERVAALNRATCPGARVEVIGTPWLDELARIERSPDVDAAVSFHWDLPLCPETRCTIDDWWPAVTDLAGRRSLLGHGHPRAARVLDRFRDAGIPVAERFEDVAARARVYVCDNSSTLFYAAALGLGVVVLDSPRYRRHVEHGLRFWEHADVGVRVACGADLASAVQEALAGPTIRAAGVVEELFPWRGEAVERAVGVLIGHTATR